MWLGSTVVCLFACSTLILMPVSVILLDSWFLSLMLINALVEVTDPLTNSLDVFDCSITEVLLLEVKRGVQTQVKTSKQRQ